MTKQKKLGADPAARPQLLGSYPQDFQEIPYHNREDEQKQPGS